MPFKDPTRQAEYLSDYHKNYYIKHRDEILRKVKDYRRTTTHKINRGKRSKPALCHPERHHRAHGLCQQCLHALWQNRAYAANPEFRNSRSFTGFKTRLKKYGLTPDGWIQLLELQNGRCAICEGPFIGFPHIDHSHRTKKVRGLLCKFCNCDLLGVLETNAMKIFPALRYLASHNELPEPFSRLIDTTAIPTADKA